MNSILYAVYGASGCGRGVMPLARAQLQRAGVPGEQVVFVDDNDSLSELNGHRVISYNEFVATPSSEHRVVVAVANSALRERLVARCSGDGVLPWSVRAESVVMLDEVSLGEGAILCPFVTLTSNVRVGSYFHGNLYCYVEHDCVVGDFVTFGPGAKCNGNVVIEDHVYVGSGAVIKQGVPGRPLVIGRGAVIGMGAVVVGDVEPGATVVGNPARPLRKG